jgi:hypothetical protein
MLHLKPSQIIISTRCSPDPTHERYPFAESAFSCAKLQPYVHDVKVVVQEGAHDYCYRVFFKRHCRLLTNTSLMKLDPNSTFRGDAIVMRIGVKGNFVNMRDRDTILADFIIRKLVVFVAILSEVVANAPQNSTDCKRQKARSSPLLVALP